MRSWYTAFNLGFMAFGVTLKGLLYLGLVPLVAAVVSLIVSAVGYLGFRYPDPAFVICGPLWGSYLLTNLVHMLTVANAANMYLGLGRWIWLLLPISLGTFGLYLLWESKNRRMAQNFITAFTSAFGAVAGVSIMLSYFCAHTNSPFDLVSFMTYPTGFRWSDSGDVGMLVLLVALVIGGMRISVARDRQQDSPGFGEDREGSLALAKKLVAGGYERVSRTVSSVSVDSAPFLSFAGSRSDVGTKRRMAAPGGGTNESASRRGPKSLGIKNLLQKFESTEDYDTKDCSTDDDSPVSLRRTLGDLTPTTASSVKVLQSTSKNLLDEYDACFSLVTVAETEDFCSVL
ncbi:putative transmembrane protein [Toxoplasma gondii RUB]|uniref:Transmembrane protein n=2 Tax=Toxoplasma gondii TaxID=5811 RepID=V4ZFJ2_TOXGV|nr:putative transmembrane protein [Toxoplasma gondii VEG]KFG60907.1 putative transmembrane protein [Toxoplasma gondii RUB]